MTRPLVLAAHGTVDPAGRAVTVEVAARSAERLGVRAEVAYVDVCGPELLDVLGRYADDPGRGEAPVVVPFFLAAGYHVRHDVPTAVRSAARSTLPGLGDGPSAQMWPHLHGTDGMFLSLLRKKA